ncbi:hypothetical protein DPMN_083332 [Dreissena polymorpha]|uniref:Uncharacterized protein n=1 Tax=Dreissena polymorpha TaxID=45954 RepID=A0A9D4BIC3_DREPO|nr:hypothetical protein DPMN_083332 [Dreissena polymorpha]
MFGRRVGKNDGDSGCGFGKLLGRFLADLLSRAARGWMRVLVSGGSSGWGLGRGRMRGGGLGLARRGCACALAACSALWELERDTAFHD